MNKRILITGGSGFLGAHLVLSARQKLVVHATYKTHSINTENCFCHEINFNEIKEIYPLLDKIKPNIVIHTAAIANPDYCEQNKNEAEIVNVLATQQIAGWCHENASKLIFTSSDMVFNGEEGRYNEFDPPDPKSYYAQTKVRAEEAVLTADSQNVVARVALVYGIGIERGSSFFEQMVDRLKKKETVRLFYDQFRTPILVNNLVEALLELAENKFSGLIHLGGTERISRWDFGVKTCHILNLPKQFLESISMYDFTAIAFRPEDVSLDCSLARSVLKTKLLDCTEGIEKLKTSLFQTSPVPAPIS